MSKRIYILAALSFFILGVVFVINGIAYLIWEPTVKPEEVFKPDPLSSSRLLTMGFFGLLAAAGLRTAASRNKRSEEK